ncbi:MAG: DNA/RNA nuclease SfsA [Thermoplasmatota archaeon]
MNEVSISIPWDRTARVVSRPNRFLAILETAGCENPIEAHVHDPGRLKEILYLGNEVLIRRSKSKNRRTEWDVIAGRVRSSWVLINSSFHRMISTSLLENAGCNPFGPLASLKPEVMVGKSRLDYLAVDDSGRKLYIEVKGCSLTRDGMALFPDAPTERGRRHLRELIELSRSGQRAGILMLVLGPGAECFAPNVVMDPEFGRVFKEALGSGVEIRPVSFELRNRMIHYTGEVPLCEGISRQQRSDKSADML